MCQHTRTHVRTIPFLCLHCFVVAKDEAAAREHALTHQHECGECGKILPTLKKLRLHESKHRHFKCPECEYSSLLRARVVQHLKKNHNSSKDDVQVIVNGVLWANPGPS
ncbi:hypothetical protein BIW11_02297 [Tropilaelaps mercedesae]|uniref:C2H2-type domain-containing protein n=1 Tax=Tropilaelaps mercedesae TaxID=418985 RepID=A0A1V9X062_9ACAR|nr:hypothetical protein BIW11_02297 [Tropilaelaps mercedesae]